MAKMVRSSNLSIARKQALLKPMPVCLSMDESRVDTVKVDTVTNGSPPNVGKHYSDDASTATTGLSPGQIPALLEKHSGHASTSR